MIKILDEMAFVGNYRSEKYFGRSYDVLDCACLPYGADEMVERFQIHFGSDEYDGWLVKMAVGSFDDEDCFLLFTRYTSPDESSDVIVQCSSLTPLQKQADIVEYVLFELKLKPKDLRWIRSDLKLHQWLLCRMDDNNNEFVIDAFDAQVEAEARKEMYERRGHKQMYWVRKAKK